MNQILICNDNIYYENIYIKKKKKNKKIYLFILFTSIVIFIFVIFYLFYSFFSKIKENKKTNNIKSKYNISSIYPSTNTYNAIKLSNDIFIIGLIEIPSINISYPILSNNTEELLKVSVCRFSGPLPNRLGNLCIAGHNYRNNTMFSNLSKININDSIYITDLNNVKLEYIVYDKFKVKENNLNCTANTKDAQITLITCDYNNTKRIVIKAKMKG